MPSRQEFLCALLMRDNSPPHPLGSKSSSFCIEDTFLMVINYNKNARKIQIISVDGKPMDRELSATARSEKCKYTGLHTLLSIECNEKTYVPPNHVSYLWPPLSSKTQTREDYDDAVLLHMTFSDETDAQRLVSFASASLRESFDSYSRASLRNRPNESPMKYALVRPLDIMPFMDHFGAFMHEYLMVDSSESGAKEKPRRVTLYEIDGKFKALWDTKQKTMNIVNAYTTFHKIRPMEE